MKQEIIVALDVPSAAAIPAILDQLPEEMAFFKVGLELFCAEGQKVLDILKARNKRIFLDLKLHDIPRTVARTVDVLADLDVDLITLHAVGGRDMMKAAAEAAAAHAHPPKLIAVTTLTSLNTDDFNELGIQRSLSDQAIALGRLAMESGLAGVVTSVLECRSLRDALGPEALLVTPGIRLPSDAVGDQKRVATPAAAVQAGASYLVVGRPILCADHPGEAARSMLENMASTAF
ncbi:MAG: orotidine-5'-phosphate decarboxylase [Spartobacteria bacterium]|nr:orotidine-5'-phosphate decarboxylase [Spartobacteria bacterium]